MNIPDLLPQHVQPFEIDHPTRWLDPLLQNGRPYTTALPSIPSAGGLRARVAVLPAQLRAAKELVRRRYAWRGYRLPSVEDLDAPEPDGTGQPVTLLAENRGRVLGTLTIRPDSPQGLLAETSYAAEIEGLRRDGRRVGELVRLAVEEGADWKAALDALVQSAWLVTRVVHALTDVVIEINPRHVRFYRRVFGFVVAAGEGMCTRVGAPSVLMQLDLEQFGRRLQSSPL